jgi:hypothetical protein
MLNPEASLATLKARLTDLTNPYLNAEETRQQLRGAIHVAEIEVSNLSHRPSTDRAAKCLAQDLTVFIELGRGSLPRD